MNIFITWSGERSRLVAKGLRDWLPDVFQNIDAWMSEVDIEAGSRWGKAVDQRLSDTKLGVLCLTRENLSAPWVMFEAGALAKTISDTYVVPYLIDLQPAELPAGPLSQFQAMRATRSDTLKLVQTVNKALDEKGLESGRVEKVYDRWWPDLEAVLEAVPEPSEEQPEKRSLEEMVEEILVLVRKNRWVDATPTFLSPADQLVYQPAGGTGISSWVVSGDTPHTVKWVVPETPDHSSDEPEDDDEK